jgi:DNA primase
MDFKKISYVEAIQELAAQLGITIEYEDYRSVGEVSETELLYDLNVETAKYFSDNLLNKPEGEIARKYFEGRKIKLTTIRAFGLGYALPLWDSFVGYAQTKKIDLEKANYLGIVSKRADGSYFDKFTGRIIFPIFSPNGRVVAFAGRVMDNKEGTAKYLNSPESKIYYKGRLLYGLSFAKEEIRRNDLAIIVEGYMDLISLYQNGIKNVVAVSGTAFTDDQVQLLSRYTKNVVLIFDADTAGIKASMRSIEILLKQDMNIKIATLPSGEDPDSFVQKNGKESFEEVIDRSQNFLEYQTDIFFKRGMFDDPVKSTEAIRELVKPIALINDELKRSLLIKSLSDKFQLREKLLESELENALNKKSKEEVREIGPVEREAQWGSIPTEKEIFETNKPKYNEKEKNIINAERELIKLLYNGNDELTGFIFNYISAQDFFLIEHQKIVSVISEALKNGEDISLASLIEKFEDEGLSNYLREITFDKYRISDRWDELKPAHGEKVLFKIAADTIKMIRFYEIDRQIEANYKMFETAAGDDEKIELMKKQQELQKQKEKIKIEFA